MASQIRSNLRTIIPLITAKLKTDLSLEDHEVFFQVRGRGKSRGDFFHPQSERHLILRVGDVQIVGEQHEAAGKIQYELARPLEVRVMTRLQLDELDRDDNFLLDSTYGHYQFEDQVLDALASFWPTDSDDNVVTTTTLKLLPSRGVTKEEHDPHWGSSILTFLIRYTPDLTQTPLC